MPHNKHARWVGLKILHVIPAVAARYGGPSSSIWGMCAALARQPGIEVELATTDADGLCGRLDPTTISCPFPVHVFPRTVSERWKYSQDLGKWLCRHAHEYDVIHAHALWTYSTGAVARAARRVDVPYVVRPAGMLSEYSLSRHAWKKRVYWSLVERRTASQAARFHATSLGERTDILRCLPSAAVSVIPNGVEQAAWDTPINSTLLRQRCGPICGDQPIALFLSRLHPKKGITELLLPAWKQLKISAFLAIVGGPDEHAPTYVQHVRNTIDEMDLTHRAAYLGPSYGQERWSMLDGADAFVLPSRSENFGIVVAEAMARSCPVVVTAEVQSAEHVAQAQSGIIVSHDARSLVRALHELLSQSDRCRALGEAGRRYAAVHFRWEHIASQLRKMYYDINVSN